jgi:2-polyprenyl-3-methyl-5-hydroxy-6-metoxy-1,4-benzoquinol methylase
MKFTKMQNPNSIQRIDIQYYDRYREWPSLFNIARDSTVMDIGCGRGVLGNYLKNRYNCNVTGIEINPIQAEYARVYLNDVVVGDIENLQVEKIRQRSFDYIIFSDSLEHLINPDLVLAKILSLMRDEKSKLLISIPNVRNFRVTMPLLILGEWEYTEEGLLDRTHLRFYTIKSITDLLIKSGFSIDKCKVDLPLSSKSGLLNFLTFGLFRHHLTSHYFIEAKRSA